MDIESALQKVAQCWCDPRTSGTVMNPDLAEVMAEMLLAEVQTPIGPMLGCATTREIFDELKTRIEMESGNLMEYKTIETDEEHDNRVGLAGLSVTK